MSSPPLVSHLAPAPETASPHAASPALTPSPALSWFSGLHPQPWAPLLSHSHSPSSSLARHLFAQEDMPGGISVAIEGGVDKAVQPGLHGILLGLQRPGGQHWGHIGRREG